MKAPTMSTWQKTAPSPLPPSAPPPGSAASAAASPAFLGGRPRFRGEADPSAASPSDGAPEPRAAFHWRAAAAAAAAASASASAPGSLRYGSQSAPRHSAGRSNTWIRAGRAAASGDRLCCKPPTVTCGAAVERDGWIWEGQRGQSRRAAPPGKEGKGGRRAGRQARAWSWFPGIMIVYGSQAAISCTRWGAGRPLSAPGLRAAGF